MKARPNRDHYSVYYMMTPRCVLNCGYCFRDTSPESLESEMGISDIMKAIEAMYHNLQVRKLTLSGGEPTFLGGKVLTDFLVILDFIRQFKHEENCDNLRIELLTNAVLLDESIIDKMKGVVERITITLDSVDDEILTRIGRNWGNRKNYLERFIKNFTLLFEKGFDLKIHTVITPVNYDGIDRLVRFVLDNQNKFRITKWKFYQYMTYNDPAKDEVFGISDELYFKKAREIESLCAGSGIELSFKDNKTMQDSMVNLTHFGKFEGFYLKNGQRTRALSRHVWEYQDMNQLVDDLHLDIKLFEKYHKLVY